MSRSSGAKVAATLRRRPGRRLHGKAKEVAVDLPESLQVSFVLRFWLEANEGPPSWRGRVIEMHEENAEIYVRDGASLIEFVSSKLAELGGVEFPFTLPSTKG